jgi:hypothetical protein
MKILNWLKAVARWISGWISGPAVIELVSEVDDIRKFLVWNDRAWSAMGVEGVPRVYDECPDRGYVVSVHAEVISPGLYGVTVTYSQEELHGISPDVSDAGDREQRNTDQHSSGLHSGEDADGKPGTGIHPEGTLPHEG